jgi:acyl carrier protein
MTAMEIRESIRGFIQSELLAGQVIRAVTDDDPLIDEGIIDSLGIMALIGFLEETFAIRIGGDELLPENFASVATISMLIAQKTGCQ